MQIIKFSVDILNFLHYNEAGNEIYGRNGAGKRVLSQI